MYFTSNIKFLRKRRGRTQDDVAVALNLKRSTLSGYENGVAQPGNRYSCIILGVLQHVDRYYAEDRYDNVCRKASSENWRGDMMPILREATSEC